MTATTSTGWCGGHAASADRTLREMRRNVRRSLTAPRVLEMARRIVAQVPARDEVAQAYAIRVWADRHFHFVKDPLGVEMLEMPSYQLDKIEAQGFIQGDCDDAATVTAALLLSVGIPCKFEAVAFGSATAPYAHVFTMAYPLDARTGTRRPAEMDITRPPSITHPTFTRRLFLEV